MAYNKLLISSTVEYALIEEHRINDIVQAGRELDML